MRFLVVGAGSIGVRHADNLVAAGHDVLVWDTDAARRDAAAARPGVAAAPGLEAGLRSGVDAVLVCTPPVHHRAVAAAALEAGVHVFVEKPLAATTVGVPELLELADRQKRRLLVGFNLRFLPSLRRARALVDGGRVGRVLAVRAEFGYHLAAWRPGRDYRENYAVRAAEGGGVLLDAIHELDYLVWLFGDPAEVFCTAGHVSRLAGDTEDLAEVTLRFPGGLLAQVHLDYLQHAYRRNCQIVGEDGVLVWDYPTQTVTVHGPGEREERHVETEPPARMYVEEMRHLVRCLEGEEAPLVDGREGLRSLRIVEAARRSAAARRWETL